MLKEKLSQPGIDGLNTAFKFTHTYITMDPICTYLFSMMIVGATEVTPGWMKVEHLGVDNEVHTSHVYTEDYLKCWGDEFIVE